MVWLKLSVCAHIFFLQTLIGKAESCEEDLTKFSSVGVSLKALLLQYKGNTKPVERRVSSLNSEYRKICECLALRLEDVKQVTEQAREFTILLDDFWSWLVIMKKDVESKRTAVLKRDVKTLKIVIEDCEVLRCTCLFPNPAFPHQADLFSVASCPFLLSYLLGIRVL